jgi:hypothetical protein
MTRETARRVLAASALGSFLVLLAPRWVAGTVPGGADDAVTMACLLGLALGALAVSGRALLELLAGPLLLALALLGPLGKHASPLGAGALAGLALVPVGAALGRNLRRAVVGAAGGVLLWTIVAATEAPPVAWFAIAGVLLVLAVVRPLVAAPFVAAAPFVVGAVLGAAGPPAHWTPYHAVGDGVLDGEPLVEAPSALGRLFPRRRVLLLGAAPGEVAAVVSAGASRVLVAELDPELARRVRGPGVEVVVGDPRALLERTGERFDLIVLTAREAVRPSSLSATLEGIRVARSRLLPGGAFAASAAWAGPWRTLLITESEAFEEHPRVHSAGAMATFAVGGRGDGELDALPPPFMTVPPSLATDDWPHVELAERGFPRAGWLPVAVIGVAFVALAAALGARPGRGDARLVLLGCAEGLVAACAQSAGALVFGATWEVRGLVLLLALGAAALSTAAHPRPRGAIWVLVVALVLMAALPVEARPFVFAIAVVPTFLVVALADQVGAAPGPLLAGLALAVPALRASHALGDRALAVVALAVALPALWRLNPRAATDRPPP